MTKLWSKRFGIHESGHGWHWKLEKDNIKIDDGYYHKYVFIRNEPNIYFLLSSENPEIILDKL